MSVVYVLVGVLVVAHSHHVESLGCVDLTPGDYKTILEIGRNKTSDLCVEEYTFVGKTDRLLDYTDTLDITKHEIGDIEYRISKIHVINEKSSSTSSPIKSSIVSGGLTSPTVTLRFIIAPGEFVLRVYLHVRKSVDRCCRGFETNHVHDAC